MTVPNPITAVVGAKLTASQWNGSERDAINFLVNPPRVSVSNTTTQSPATATFTLQSWDTEAYDTDTMHSTSSNTSRLVATTAGTYNVIAQVQFVPNAAGVRAIQVRKNAAGSNAGGTLVAQANSGLGQAAAGTSALFVKDVPLAAADYLEIFIYQNSGGAIATVAGDSQTYASMRFVGSP